MTSKLPCDLGFGLFWEFIPRAHTLGPGNADVLRGGRRDDRGRPGARGLPRSASPGGARAAHSGGPPRPGASPRARAMTVRLVDSGQQGQASWAPSGRPKAGPYTLV